MFIRSSGVLLHPTSLPGPYGIGDLGEHAYRFIDFLEEAGQSLWQILPPGPTGYGDSPYQCFSAFAGNPFLVSPDIMVRDEYIPADRMPHIPDFPIDKIDYGWAIYWKNQLFETAHSWFVTDGGIEQREKFEVFCKERSWWLDDYALFMALKQHHIANQGGMWNTWPADIRDRKPKALEVWRTKLSNQISLEKFRQFLFFTQWLDLKQVANQKGIKIVGDMPIFVAFDSADVWTNPELFYLDENGNPTVVAGVPPDYFSETGQRWGNPLYRWDIMKQDGYEWWTKRIKASFELTDIMRIDHFRGFEANWEIPAAEPTAMVGTWRKGPGIDLFKALERKLGKLPIIAEDLGVITPEVTALRDGAGFPGMKILQFAFGGEKNSAFLPHSYTADCVVYTGSHDNETTLGWYQNATDDEQDHVRRYLGRDGHDIVWDLIRMAHQSVATMSVIPMQDLMQLDNSARMNFPGKTGGYWSWRFTEEMLTESISNRFKDLTDMYGRSPQ
jgi:4-alpha-glucanotransferase